LAFQPPPPTEINLAKNFWNRCPRPELFDAVLGVEKTKKYFKKIFRCDDIKRARNQTQISENCDKKSGWISNQIAVGNMSLTTSV
jgi:hypothetical protein